MENDHINIDSVESLQGEEGADKICVPSSGMGGASFHLITSCCWICTSISSYQSSSGPARTNQVVLFNYSIHFIHSHPWYSAPLKYHAIVIFFGFNNVLGFTLREACEWIVTQSTSAKHEIKSLLNSVPILSILGYTNSKCSNKIGSNLIMNSVSDTTVALVLF